MIFDPTNKIITIWISCLHKLFNILQITMLAAFGDDDVDVLVSHFKPVLDEAGVQTSLIPDEWTMLKEALFSCKDHPSSSDWPSINKRHRDQYPNILNLIDIILTLPASTADCERGFNFMKMIKSDWRSKLRADRLTDLMRILLDSPDIGEYDPTPAVNLWNASSERVRRPDAMDRMPHSELEEESDDENFLVVGALRMANAEACIYKEELSGKQDEM